MLDRQLQGTDNITGNIIKSFGYYTICEPINRDHWERELDYWLERLLPGSERLTKFYEYKFEELKARIEPRLSLNTLIDYYEEGILPNPLKIK